MNPQPAPTSASDWDRLYRQRQAQADALAVALSAIENLDFAAWERSGHDSATYRRMTGVPSLAEAASAIRAVLGQ